MTNKDKDSLNKLVIKEGDGVNREELADLISSYVNFVKKETGGTKKVFRDEFYELSNKQKIIICLAAEKAMSELGFAENDGLTMGEVVDHELMPKGSAEGTLSKLNGDIVDAREVEGTTQYFLPQYRIGEAKEALKDNK